MDGGAWWASSGRQLTLPLSPLSSKPPHAAEEAPWEEGPRSHQDPSLAMCAASERNALFPASLLLPALSHQVHCLCGCVCIQAQGSTGARPTRPPPGGAWLPAGPVRQLLLQTETSLTLHGCLGSEHAVGRPTWARLEGLVEHRPQAGGGDTHCLQRPCSGVAQHHFQPRPPGKPRADGKSALPPPRGTPSQRAQT